MKSARKLLEIREHSASVYSCSSQNEFIYSGSGDKFLTRWKRSDGAQDKFAIRFEQAIYKVEVYGNYLFAGLANGDLHIFDLTERKELRYYTQHKKAIFAISVNPFKKQVYVADAAGNLSVWDLTTFDLLLYLPLDCGKIRDMQLNPDGTRMLIACQDGSFRIFDTANFNELSTQKAHLNGTTAVLYHPLDENLIISGGKDAYIRLWNAASGEMLKEIPAHNFAVYRLIPCGINLVSCSRDKSIKIWDQNLNFIEKLDVKSGGHSHSVNDLTKIDEQHFASCSDDRRIIVWELS